MHATDQQFRPVSVVKLSFIDAYAIVELANDTKWHVNTYHEHLV